MATNKHKEKISAFLDNEIHRDELMSFSLSSEPEDAAVVRRYQMVGETLRGEMGEACFIDVSRAVHEALLGESHAVQQGRRAAAGHTAAATKAAESNRGGFALSSWFRPVAGMAVAASVAVVMVVTLSAQNNPLPAPVASNNIEQQPVVAQPLRLAVENKAASKKTPDLDPRLVNRHLEFATQDTMQGRMPYVRAVSYQSKNK
jgi:negative regulator of sigma E activity